VQHLSDQVASLERQVRDLTKLIEDGQAADGEVIDD